MREETAQRIHDHVPIGLLHDRPDGRRAGLCLRADTRHRVHIGAARDIEMMRRATLPRAVVISRQRHVGETLHALHNLPKEILILGERQRLIKLQPCDKLFLKKLVPKGPSQKTLVPLGRIYEHDGLLLRHHACRSQRCRTDAPPRAIHDEAAAAGIRPRLHGLHHARIDLRLHPVVRVAKADIRPTRRREAEIPRMAHAVVRRVNHAHACIPRRPGITDRWTSIR